MQNENSIHASSNLYGVSKTIIRYWMKEKEELIKVTTPWQAYFVLGKLDFGLGKFDFVLGNPIFVRTCTPAGPQAGGTCWNLLHVPHTNVTSYTHSIKLCAVKFLWVKFVFLMQFNLYWLYKSDVNSNY